MNRRKFLARSASTIGSLCFSGGLLFSNAVLSEGKIKEQAKLQASPVLFSRSQWQTLIAIQDHLFPAKNGAPGASQFNAKAWLYQSLTYPESNPEVIKIYHAQLNQTKALAQKQFNKAFTQLSENEKELILRQLEKNHQSQKWLAEILNNIIEALLTDPVYGSNTNAIGWKWLGHAPGFPRPSVKQKYYLLNS